MYVLWYKDNAASFNESASFFNRSVIKYIESLIHQLLANNAVQNVDQYRFLVCIQNN